MINILCCSVKEEGAELHADSSRTVEEERQRERSSGQEKGRISYTKNRRSQFQLRIDSNKDALFSGVLHWICLCSQEAEYNLLEEELQKTLSDLGRREKQLAEAELEVRTPNVFILV